MTLLTRRLPLAPFLLSALLALGMGSAEAESGATRTRAASAVTVVEGDEERAALVERALAAVQDLMQRKPVDGPSPPESTSEQGPASFYGRLFHQRRTASGERFDMRALTAAHPSLPFGTRVCVKSLVNGRHVQVRINDRGPHVGGRIIDLSQAAAEALDMVGRGTKRVVLWVLGQGDECAAPSAGASVSS